MDDRKTFFQQFWRCTSRICGDRTGSQCKQENPDGFTRESRILASQMAERAALIQHAERLCAAEKAREEAVLRRLKLSVQPVALPSPQPPPFPRRSNKSPLRRKRLSPLFSVPPLNLEDTEKNQRSPESLKEEEDSIWDEVHPCGREAQPADRDERVAASTRSASISPVDDETPRELREIPLIGSCEVFESHKPAPPPPSAVPPARRGVSRLPVLSAKVTTAEKEVANRCRLQSAQGRVEAVIERLQRFQLDFVPQPPAAAKSNAAVKPLVPTPPTVPPPKRRGTRAGTVLRPAQSVSGAGKRTAPDCSIQTASPNEAELQPLARPVEGLSLSFKLLSSDDWMKKVEGLKTIRALAQHHSETLKTELHQVCLVLTEEVKNLRLAVACEAMKTVSELYVHLGKAVDPEVEGTGRALLLKLAQTTNAFIHQQANLALDAMVQHCSFGRIVSALLNTGLSHLCVAIRGSTARHLHLLADSHGAAHILTAGRSLTERFLTAVAKMCVDGAPEVRHHGQIMLHQLALHKDFLKLWTTIVPDKERRALTKILQKTK